MNLSEAATKVAARIWRESVRIRPRIRVKSSRAKQPREAAASLARIFPKKARRTVGARRESVRIYLRNLRELCETTRVASWSRVGFPRAPRGRRARGEPRRAPEPRAPYA